MRKNVIVIKTTPFTLDPRLPKEIETLIQGGYSVTLLYWDRDGKYSSISTPGIKKGLIEIPFRLKTPYGPRVLLTIFLWWWFVFSQLLKLKWDIAHAINFDSIVPAVIAAKLKKKPVIYEMYDTYEDQISLPGLLRAVCLMIDKLFMRLSDYIILVDESRIKEFTHIPNDNIEIIYNAQNDLLLDTDTRKDVKNPRFKIFYAGTLLRGRSIENMIAAIRSIDGVELVIAGYGDLTQKIQSEVAKSLGKLKFIGAIPHEEVMKNTLESDLLFSLYDPKVPLNKFASSNKVFEAMVCSKPILVSDGTSMDELVKKENCGLTVDCTSIPEIQKAIIRLRDNPGFCHNLGSNGRKAYDSKYNWKIMGKILFKVYETVERK